MPAQPDADQLRSIRTFPSLVRYLRDELDWPIDADNVDELTFDYSPEELGFDPKHAVKTREIKQLRPLVTGQPWGIFWVSFEKKKLPMVVLRRNEFVAALADEIHVAYASPGGHLEKLPLHSALHEV
jgi:hypothetical protein